MATTYKWYGTRSDVAVPIVEDPALHAVHYEGGTDLFASLGAGLVSALQDKVDVRLQLRGSGVMVVEAKGVGALAAVGPTVDHILGVGQDASPATFSEPGLRFEESGVVAHTTGRLYLRFKLGVDRRQALHLLHNLRGDGLIGGWEARERPGRLVYRIQATNVRTDPLFALAHQLHNRSEVERCYPYLGVRAHRADPCPREWHLRRAPHHWVGYANSEGETVGKHADTIDAGLEAVAAWQHARGFRFRHWLWWRRFWARLLYWWWHPRVVVAVLDEGIDTDHYAFSGWGKVVDPANTVGIGPADDPRPQDPREVHGTPMAGLAVARGGSGAHGVAPDAALMPIRMMEPLEDSGGEVSLAEEAAVDAFNHAREKGADVISCSWLWPDSSLPVDLDDAIHEAAETGRDGKGCVVLFATGNRREPDPAEDDPGLTQLAQNPAASHADVVAVGACHPALDHAGAVAEVSEATLFGSNLWCLFPVSAGGNYPPMFLVDRSGAEGNNGAPSPEGDYFLDGTASTSKACAGAAGVAALVLSADFDLPRSEVKRILGACCEKINTAPTPATTSLSTLLVEYGADGRSDSHGHGRLNALRAVELALGLCEPGGGVA